MKPYRPQKIYIEKDAVDYPSTAVILKNLPGVPHEIIENEASLRQEVQNRPDPIGEGKRFLLLKRDKGRSFKPFPESEDYLSCDYFTLHVAEGCDLECSYCILQAYLTNPFLTVYVNLEEMLDNLQRTLRENPGRFFRVGTGQLADSLSLDPITEFSKILVPFFAKQENAVLELKTKSSFVKNLQGLTPQGKTLVSWSMNSKKIQTEEEHKCASLEERLNAAKEVLAQDYRVGFHLDPIIDYPDWEKDYEEVIAKIFSEIPEEKIAWMSLGCLRFMPELKGIMQSRFPKSQLPLGEWITGMDGKMRYFKPRRVEIYKTVVEKIRRRAPDVTLYLSMESPEVWRRVFGAEPSRAEVCALLDRAGRPRHAPVS
jgi:spore photoproduct lyase